ncbi:MAG: hypothetical protein KC668_27280, partial [Myxococcales bacterium]|nr:hypothetical protein [Myxococcales bacterium]
MTRAHGAAACALWTALMLGCGADGGEYPDGSVELGPPGDMGVPTDMGIITDMASPDIGTGEHATLFPADPIGFAPFAEAALGVFGPANDVFPPTWTACYDEHDGHSCATAPCTLLATCCVANGDCASSASDSALPTSLSFSTCASGASALSCVPGQPLVPLGASTPTVEAGGMRPGGDGVTEGGVLVGTPLDLRVERLSLRVVFASPVSCPDGACVESAAVSVAPPNEVALGVVRPVAGLLYSASRADVSLVIGTQRRASWPLEDANAAFTLELLPSGEVRVLRDDTLLTDALRYSPPADAQVVLHGHNGELQGARVRSLQTQRYQSEAPGTFGARTLVTLQAPSDVSPF